MQTATASADKSQVETVILEAIARLNEQLPAELRVGVAPSTMIVGEGSMVDSLSLVVLLVDIEEQISNRFGWTLNILDEGLGGEGGSRFKSLSELVDWVWNKRA